LRSTKAIKENDHYIVNRDTRNERRVPWPKFQLTMDERDRLAGRLLAEGVDASVAARYLGTTVGWVKRFEADAHSVSEAARLLAERGPLGLLDPSTPTELSTAWTAILRRESGSRKSALPTSTNKGDARSNPTVGSRFGRLEILSLQRDGRGRLIAKVRCDCDGSEKDVRASDLGKIKSCGCLRRERMAAMRSGKG
jgi:hypothetical protein